MTEDLYLIAHKVRGEPAFDVAIHMCCPTCEGTSDHCSQCDGAGHWWIIPTSGHRAFPWWHADLAGLHYASRRNPKVYPIEFDALIEEMPPSIRDHYTTEREATKSLVDMLGLKPKKLPPIVRRL